MKRNTFVSWILAAYFFTCAVNAVDSGDKEEELFLETSNDVSSMKAKKPFCNAFTGCGKKRSYDSSLEQNSLEDLSQKISPLFYRALMQVINEDIRRGNNQRLNINSNDLLNIHDQDYTGYQPKLPRKRYQL